MTALREFINGNVLGGLLLAAAAIFALLWSNSPFAATYEQLWTTPTGGVFLGLHLPEDLRAWVNDGLMAVFFLLVGLELKRECRVGELDTPRRAVIPAAAALGGAVVPALIFLAIVGPSSEVAVGWGIPMATDIAFALGVLALVGRHVPSGLRVFVTALAIVDDLVAVVVIAVFYTADLALPAVVAAALIVATLVGLNRLGVRSLAPYLLLGVALWLAVHESGVHATVAGVLLALSLPGPRKDGRHSMSPLVRLEHSLNRPSGFLIVPIFALANAGVSLSGDLAGVVSDPLVLGVGAGLIVGKQVGIFGAAWLACRLGLGALPAEVSWRHLYAATWICGIGFTMSLFISDLAFGSSPGLDKAKVGILGASIIAGTVGFLLLRFPAGSSSRYWLSIWARWSRPE